MAKEPYRFFPVEDMTYRHSQASLKQRQKKEKILGDWKFSEKKKFALLIKKSGNASYLSQKNT